MLPMGHPPAFCRLVLRRFLNYAITTPIIVYLVSCVSDFSGWRVSRAACLPVLLRSASDCTVPQHGRLAFTGPLPVFS